MIKLFSGLKGLILTMIVAVSFRSTARGTAFLVQPMSQRVVKVARTRVYSTTIRRDSSAVSKVFFDTPLGTNGTHLLAGLDVYSVPASADGHPLAVYGIQSENPAQFQENSALYPILLLHGRTWSSVPVFHLHLNTKGEPQATEESRSLMQVLLAKGALLNLYYICFLFQTAMVL
jgi:hypothetical protein